MVAKELAIKAGLNIAVGKLKKFNSDHHTYLTKRFDRAANGERIHFASAMTLLGYIDGENSGGVSYLEIAEFIVRNGLNVERDLEELWRRIVFSICIKNTDDHLRNHGFLLAAKGWSLSPAYDVNPNEYGKGLHLNISDKDNSLDLELAMDVAEYFRIDNNKAKEIRNEVIGAVSDWKKLAIKNKISRTEIDQMSLAFILD